MQLKITLFGLVAALVLGVLVAKAGQTVATAPEAAVVQASERPPLVYGLTVRQAKQRLDAVGFEYDRFAVGEASDTGAYRFMLPARGSKPPDTWRVCYREWDAEWKLLDLYVSPACVITMPRLVGKRLGKAWQTIDALGLFHHQRNVDPKYAHLVNDDWGTTRKSVVCTQKPPAGGRVSLRHIHHFVFLTVADRGNCP